MSQAAVFNTCQIPFKSGFPATVRRGAEAAGLAPGVCGAAGVSANQRIKSTETAPVTNFVSFFICRLFDPNGWLILPTDAAAVKPLGSTLTPSPVVPKSARRRRSTPRQTQDARLARGA